MAYRLKQGESAPAGVRRMAAEQLGKAIEHLESKEGERDEHIHEGRKATKRLRALVRLVHRELGDEVYALENQWYRDAGQRLSGLRDATVLVETLDRLVEYLGKKAPESRFARVRAWLVERRERAYGQAASSDRDVQEVVADLELARQRLETWDLRHQGWRGLRAGLQRIYTQGLREFEAAYWLPGDEAFHDWRKRVKYLWYHTQILQNIWPPGMQALADELDQLGELLGQYHDLAVLRATVVAEFPRAGATATVRALERRIDEVRARMQARARLMAERIYAERPRDFTRRLRRYWEVWKANSSANTAWHYGQTAPEDAEKEKGGKQPDPAGAHQGFEPFELDEESGRRTGFDPEKMRRALESAGLDAALITSLPNFRYATGIQIQTHAALPQRLQMLVFPAAEEPVLLACETREVLTSQAPDWLEDIRTYREFEKGPMDFLAAGLQEKGLAHARLGIERAGLATRFWEDLRQVCPYARFREVGALLDELRAIKAPVEIEALRRAYIRTHEAIRLAFESTRIGDTEAQIAARIRAGLVDRGATQIDFDIAVIGERSPWAHPPPGQRRLGAGEILRVDVAATFGLYAADVGRTAMAGHWQPGARAAFDKLAAIRQDVIPQLEIGTPIGQIYSRILEGYVLHNLPTPPIHTLLWGHSIGIEVHEPPMVSPGEETALAPGMVLNIEPDVRPDGLCLTHECTYLVGATGVELLAAPDPEVPLTVDPA